MPDFQTLMLPLLQFAGDKQEHSFAEARIHLSGTLNLTDEELVELLPSGTQPRFNNRVAWTKTHMERAGLLLKTWRGCFQISPRGTETLNHPPAKIDIDFLLQFPEFEEFRNKSKPQTPDSPEEASPDDATPEKALEAAYQQIREDLAAELLEQIKLMSPKFFERLVMDLMLSMGYGGSSDRMASLTNAGPDEGIHGIINEDKLGLDVVYLQAKRWENMVGRPEIQKSDYFAVE